MQTIYQIVEEVCLRDFPILARLSDTQQNKFIDNIYQDVLSGDNPTEIAEHELYDYIQEFIVKAIIKMLISLEENSNVLQNMS